MASTERRVGTDGRPYYRARYVCPDGSKRTVKGSDGKVLKFPTKVTARKAAQRAEDDADAAASRGRWVPPEQTLLTLADFVLGVDGEDGWIARADDLAKSSAQNYRHHLKHILPTFGALPLRQIESREIDAWERRESAAGKPSSARTYRSTLHLILEDAATEGLLTHNPAKRRRGRGRRAGRSASRGPAKAITGALGMLLLAERMSLLSDRDDEFVATVMQGYTGMRWGEVVGLEPGYVSREAIHIEWQLYELDTGEFDRCPPKDDSYRVLDAPVWLTGMVSRHIARNPPQKCPCHGRRYVFRGRGLRRAGARSGPTLADVATAAKTSTGTVSNVLNHPDRVAESTRTRTEKALADLGYVRGGSVAQEAAHWRRSGHATWLVTPAASGWYPPKAPQPQRPVPIIGAPFPGVPARGRGAVARATASWVPIRHGLTRHGLRHSHRTVMEELGTPRVLMDERMGHIDGSVSARYAHVTDTMRRRLMEDLTEQWETALQARREMHPRSPVAALDALLTG